MKNNGLDQGSRVTTYLPERQEVYGAMYMVLSTAGDPTSLMASATRATSALDQSVPVLDVTTMASRVRDSLEERRFATVLLEVLGGIALALTVIGIYGLVSYRVSRSVRELGLRMALGASSGAILRSVLRHGAGLASVGVTLGIGAASLKPGPRTIAAVRCRGDRRRDVRRGRRRPHFDVPHGELHPRAARGRPRSSGGDQD